ncbi:MULTISPECIES: hypothetical protein [unclassified Methylobacterium]|uniref:hypothetical protein n=1 Tax=unclassified Methylobacterium TaxID=2615210 RepID=UPI0011C1F8BE|nr:MULTISPECIES: hypothetical protein [unclassified Methylobacterium]QEE37978.1 hypothetical protein FVA80_02335 [Methylobacterium sp. WL1]TXN59818.1 hypothetical protein FV241_00165 [Methylobacterium sp. WL2]
MRMVHALNETVGEGAQQVKQTGVGGDAKIVYALLTGMVSDKIVYPVREYATNAWEVSPPKKPFEIELPTRFNPQYTIRDFGPGLPHSFMMNKYAKIGESTKDGDDDAVGGWGFGSKAALAYLMRSDGAGSFTVISRFRGFRRVYSIGVSEAGKIQISFLGEWVLDAEDRGTGLEISFPVRESDINRFHEHAKAVLWSFHPRPVITPAVDFGTPRVLSKGDGWTVYRKESVPFDGPQVMLGPVMYPIDPYNMPSTNMIDAGTCIVFEAKIGTISVSASRENLQYDDRTQSGLQALFDAYKVDWTRSAKAQIDACDTYFQARWKATDIASTLPGNQWYVARELGWRGFSFEDELFPSGCVKAAKWPEMRGRNTFPGAPVPFKADWTINPAELQDRTIVIQHNTSRSLERLELAGLIDQKLLWVRCKRPELPYALQRMGNPDYVLLDDIKLPKQERGKREKRPESVKRRKVMDLASCATWQELVDHDDELLYVRIAGRGKKLTYTLSFEGETREFNDRYNDPLLSILRRMRKNGLEDKIGSGMTCVVLGEDEAPLDHWISLGDHLVELLDEAIDPTQVAPTIPWNDSSFPQLLRQIRDRKVDLGMAPQQLRDAFYEMIALSKARETLVRDDNDHDRLAAVLLELTGTDLKTVAKDPTLPVRNAWYAVVKTHPMLPLILNNNEWQQYARHGYGGYTFTKEGQKAIDHYFGLIAK